jgi:DNA-binding CsgD family transcriptional regulator
MLSNTNLLAILELSNKCLSVRSDTDEIKKILDELLHLVPFESALIAYDNHSKLDLRSTTQVIMHGISEEWCNMYFAEGLDKIDPILHKAETSNQKAFSWKNVYKNAPVESNKFINLAQDFELREGMTCLYKNDYQANCSLISLTGTNDSMCQDHLDILEYIIPHFHEILNHTGTHCRDKIDAPKLTNRETEVLSWIKDGKGSWEISVILAISERTVKFHISNVFTKLNVINRPQAIAKALRYRLIDV